MATDDLRNLLAYCRFKILDDHGYFSLPARFPMVRRTYDLIVQFLNGEQSVCQKTNAVKKT